MASSSVAFLLTLSCLAAGVQLPLKEGTSVESLLNSTVTLWEDIPQPVDLVVNGTLSNWGGVFLGVMQDAVKDTIIDPFTAAYNEEITSSTGDELGLEELSTDANVTAGGKNNPFYAQVVLLVEHPATQIYSDITTIGSTVTEIVPDLPNWLDTQRLVNVDLSKVDINGGSLFQLLLSNTDIPEYQQKNFQQLQNSMKSLSSRASQIGHNYGRSVKMALQYLKTAYPLTAQFLREF